MASGRTDTFAWQKFNGECGKGGPKHADYQASSDKKRFRQEWAKATFKHAFDLKKKEQTQVQPSTSASI